jgi:hypothetical protein
MSLEDADEIVFVTLRRSAVSVQGVGCRNPWLTLARRIATWTLP